MRTPDKAVLETTVASPDDFASVEEFLQLLAKAVRHFHTYPANSPFCTEAIAACHSLFASLERRDGLVIRVSPTELIVDHKGVGAGTIVEQELVRRLHRARVTAVEIDRVATQRHFSHFCTALLRCEELAKTKTTFAELLADQGVETIIPVMAQRPEVFDLGAPPDPLCNLVAHEQKRRQAAPPAAAGPVDYLYPPDKGWVRLDPGSSLESVSLTDLPVLVDNPADVATMLLRLTDDDSSDGDEHKTPLERKYTDVTMLFASLDPRLARTMFAKLARAVLQLEPAGRNDLLRRTILPGLLDGRSDGAVLQDFPDTDLADSLCLLLELETAAPEVLTAALNRLELPADRRASIVPLIDARLGKGAGAEQPATQSNEREIDKVGQRLLRIEPTPGKDFSEFAAFDLSMDDQAAATIVATKSAIGATDLLCARLSLLSHLVKLEPSPTVVEPFLERTLALFDELGRAERWKDLATWATSYRDLAEELRDTRPDIAEAVENALAAFYVPARAKALVGLYQSKEMRPVAEALIEAFGAAIAPALVALLDSPEPESSGLAMVSLLSEHAEMLAPGLVGCLDQAGTSAIRAIVKVLGCAGPGYEGAISTKLEEGDEQTSREALRALARIGTAQAAAIVTRQLQFGKAGRRAAEEALWHFPAVRATSQVRQLLGSRDFVVRHPDVAARLLTRAAHAGTDGLDAVLAELEPLRFYFWNPGVVRVARRARELRTR